MLHEEFPSIPLALIHKVIAFCLENQEVVDAYLLAYHTELSEQEAAHKPSAAAERIRQSLATKTNQVAAQSPESS
jgi:hypothetical protein